jgi:hypothetical protein
VDGVARIEQCVGSRRTVLTFVALQDELARETLTFLPIGNDPPLTVHAIARRGAGRVGRKDRPSAARRDAPNGQRRGMDGGEHKAKPVGSAMHPEREAAMK